ncbi:hypothetical protein KPATCC21470_2729 [Kitasatospora purpeofusca]
MAKELLQQRAGRVCRGRRLAPRCGARLQGPSWPRLVFPAEAWQSFVQAVRSGEFGDI